MKPRRAMPRPAHVSAFSPVLQARTQKLIDQGLTKAEPALSSTVKRDCAIRYARANGAALLAIAAAVSLPVEQVRKIVA